MSARINGGRYGLRQQLLTFGKAHCKTLFAEIGHGPIALVCVGHQ